MAKQEERKKTRRSRKTRTAVSSASESEADQASPENNGSRKSQQQDNVSPVVNSPLSENTEDAGLETTAAQQNVPQPKATSPQQAFEDFYLKQATKEFANDLEKLRSAPDFSQKSVPVLIEALRQGGACFTPEERRRIGVATLEGGGGIQS